MGKWYHTFGCGQINEGKVQPIIATTYEKSRQKMFELYGNKFAFSYPEKEWLELVNNVNRGYRIETELPTITVE